MKLTRLVGECEDGECPTIYATYRGTPAIQGGKVNRGLVSRSLLRESAYRAIRDAIVDGTLAPGERLNDGDLVAWLGVSRTPVREALARLEQAGLVRTKPGRYTIVSPLDVRAVRAAQSVTSAMHEAMHELAVRKAVPQLDDVEGAVAATRANWQTLLPLLDASP